MKNLPEPLFVKEGKQTIPPLEKGDGGGLFDDLLWLAHRIIFHNPTDHCLIKGKPQLMNSLPPIKAFSGQVNTEDFPLAT